jgi:hypothetical protein
MSDPQGYGQYTPPPGPPQKVRKHKFRNYVVIPAGILLAVILAVGVVAAVAGGKPARTPTAPVTSGQASASPGQNLFTDPSGGTCLAPQAAAGYCPGDAPSPSDSPQDLTGPLGTLFTITETDSSTGAQDSYEVTAVRILDPAAGSDEFDAPDPGSRLIGVEFRITGTGGYARDDANVDASVQGDDGQVYQADFTSLAAGTNFDAGDFSVTSGRTQVGWVTFQLPQGVKVSTIQWQTDITDTTPPATWTTG